MKKSLYVLGIVFLLSLVSVFGISSNNMRAVFTFDDDCTTESVNSYDGTNNGATYISSGGLNGGACDFEESESDYVNIDDVTGSWVGSGGSMSLWIKQESFGTYRRPLMLSSGLDSTNERWLGFDSWDSDAYNSFIWRTSTANNRVEDTQDLSSDTDYHNLIMKWDSSGHINGYYVDGVLIGTDSDETISNLNTLITKGMIGTLNYRGSPAGYFDGLIDEVYFFTYELTSDNITDLQTQFYPFTDVEDVSLSIDTNLINNTINYNDENINISFNGTYGDDNTNNLFNCTIYDNVSVLGTAQNVNLNTNQVFMYNFTTQETDFYFNIYCENNETNNITGQYKYSVDLVRPIINTSFVNDTVYTFGDLISFTTTFTDTNLFAYNITVIDDSTGLVYDSKTYYLENISSSAVDKVVSYYASVLGNYTIVMESWDSHTKYEIDDKDIKQTFKDDKKLYSIDGTDFMVDNSVSFVKDKDRYKFVIDYTDKKVKWKDVKELDKEKEIVLNNKNLIYVKDSKYKGHFVDLINNIWIDFQSDDVKDFKVVKEEGVYKVKFKIDKEKVTFNSIGDLNYNSLEYKYSVVEETSLNDEYLSSINDNLVLLNKGVNMIGYIILFVALWLYFFLSEIFNISSFMLNMISAIIFIILGFIFNVNDNSMMMYLSFLGVVVQSIRMFNQDE